MELPRMGLWKQENGKVPVSPRQPAPQRLSLVERVGRLAGAVPARTGEGEEPGEDRTPQVCADGYVRRSPVQPYRRSPGRGKRRWRYAVAGLLVLAAAGLLFLAAHGPF